MALKQTIEMMDLLDSPTVSGEGVIKIFHSFTHLDTNWQRVEGEEGSTDFVKIRVDGREGKSVGGTNPTIGIIGRLGGIGARPSRIGLVSDADGAVAALAVALKLSEMSERGDRLEGDVVITTHVCPHAPTLPHEPVDFMGSPVEMEVMNQYEVLPEMEAILSIDTTKGNRVINHKGIAISPTVKEGYILRVCERLLDLVEISSGKPAVTFPLSIQDITPYENGLYHINSILQPACATSAPVVGVAITTESVVPGCSTGASHEEDISLAAKFAIEVAKEFTAGKLDFYDREEFGKLQRLYGSLASFQTSGFKE